MHHLIKIPIGNRKLVFKKCFPILWIKSSFIIKKKSFSAADSCTDMCWLRFHPDFPVTFDWRLIADNHQIMASYLHFEQDFQQYSSIKFLFCSHCPRLAQSGQVLGCLSMQGATIERKHDKSFLTCCGTAEFRTWQARNTMTSIHSGSARVSSHGRSLLPNLGRKRLRAYNRELKQRRRGRQRERQKSNRFD